MSDVTEKEGVFSIVDDVGNVTRLYPDVKTDKTLSESGKPADSASVGEKIREIDNNVKAELENINSQLDSALYIVSFDASSGTLVTRSADYVES